MEGLKNLLLDLFSGMDLNGYNVVNNELGDSDIKKYLKSSGNKQSVVVLKTSEYGLLLQVTTVIGSSSNTTIYDLTSLSRVDLGLNPFGLLIR